MNNGFLDCGCSNSQGCDLHPLQLPSQPDNVVRDARHAIRSRFEKDRDFRRAYVDNIAMLLYDRYGLKDWSQRNHAATQILDFIFTDKTPLQLEADADAWVKAELPAHLAPAPANDFNDEGHVSNGALEFDCPRCHSFYFGTAGAKKPMGHCNGDGCSFTWWRSDDRLYFRRP